MSNLTVAIKIGELSNDLLKATTRYQIMHDGDDFIILDTDTYKIVSEPMRYKEAQAFVKGLLIGANKAA